MQDPFAIQQGNNNQNNRNNRNHPFGNIHDQHSQIMAQHQMSNPFALMNQMMDQQMSSFNGMMNAPSNSSVYSSSSVMTYSNSGDGKPKIYQESSQVRQVPGGVKETRHMVRDSERGMEKVAVGHHIGERAHVIERKKMNGGDVEECVNLENLDDGEIPEFNQEFETKLASQMRSSHHHHRPHIGANQPFAIEDGARKKDRKSKSKSKH